MVVAGEDVLDAEAQIVAHVIEERHRARERERAGAGAEHVLARRFARQHHAREALVARIELEK